MGKQVSLTRLNSPNNTRAKAGTQTQFCLTPKLCFDSTMFITPMFLISFALYLPSFQPISPKLISCCIVLHPLHLITETFGHTSKLGLKFVHLCRHCTGPGHHLISGLGKYESPTLSPFASILLLFPASQ